MFNPHKKPVTDTLRIVESILHAMPELTPLCCFKPYPTGTIFVLNSEEHLELQQKDQKRSEFTKSIVLQLMSNFEII